MAADYQYTHESIPGAGKVLLFRNDELIAEYYGNADFQSLGMELTMSRDDRSNPILAMSKNLETIGQ